MLSAKTLLLLIHSFAEQIDQGFSPPFFFKSPMDLASVTLIIPIYEFNHKLLFLSKLFCFPFLKKLMGFSYLAKETDKGGKTEKLKTS